MMAPIFGSPYLEPASPTATKRHQYLFYVSLAEVLPQTTAVHRAFQEIR
jgi:hypothetical protein